MIDEKKLITDLMSVSIDAGKSYGNGMKRAIEVAIDIVNKQPKIDGWITGRNPTREECGKYGTREFQATIDIGKAKTVSVYFYYENVGGKEVGRWKWRFLPCPWKVIAWKPLSEPYIPTED